MIVNRVAPCKRGQRSSGDFLCLCACVCASFVDNRLSCLLIKVRDWRDCDCMMDLLSVSAIDKPFEVDKSGSSHLNWLKSLAGATTSAIFWCLVLIREYCDSKESYWKPQKVWCVTCVPELHVRMNRWGTPGGVTWVDFILIVFITWNSSLEPLLEGLFAQIHIDLSWRGFGRNRTGDLQITQIWRSPALFSTELWWRMHHRRFFRTLCFFRTWVE